MNLDILNTLKLRKLIFKHSLAPKIERKLDRSISQKDIDFAEGLEKKLKIFPLKKISVTPCVGIYSDDVNDVYKIDATITLADGREVPVLMGDTDGVTELMETIRSKYGYRYFILTEGTLTVFVSALLK